MNCESYMQCWGLGIVIKPIDLIFSMFAEVLHAKYSNQNMMLYDVMTCLYDLLTIVAESFPKIEILSRYLMWI